MITQTRPSSSSTDLSAKLTGHIQELAEATDAARMSETMLRYLDMYAKFHKYSPNNVWLILMACPYATLVAGFNKWRSMGRCVIKGEQGIPILAPVLVKIENEDDEEEEKLIGFKVVHVFDFSQTEGKPLPEPPDWKSSEQNALLNQRLTQFAKDKGISVQIEKLPGDTQGVSSGGTILISHTAGTKTLIHEIAHEIMHQGSEQPVDKDIRELEAEAVAYVVGRHFDLEGLTSPNYLALHGANAEMFKAHVERIRNASSEIIKAVAFDD